MQQDTTTSLLLSNLRLLDIVSPDTILTPQIISSESTLHALFHSLSHDDTAKAFSHCWPIYDPLQTKEFRIVAYKWLSDLKSKGLLGSTIIRKSLLDDRQGERYELLLLALSSYILRIKIPDGLAESKRLALSTTPSDIETLQVHCLVHSYKLSKHVRTKHQIHDKTQSFAHLLHDQDRDLSEKEKTRNRNLDVESIHQQCTQEQSRWERNWPTIKNEWILESIRSKLSPQPPSTHFLSQPYHTAFHNPHTVSRTTPPDIIQSSTRTIETNISSLQTTQSHLTAEILRLESLLQKPSPSPRKSSLRNSLPPTPNLTPSPTPSRTHGLKFSRSSSRVSRRSESVSPRSMAAEHVETMEALGRALKELEGEKKVEKEKVGGVERNVERSAIPRRLVGVSSKV